MQASLTEQSTRQKATGREQEMGPSHATEPQRKERTGTIPRGSAFPALLCHSSMHRWILGSV